MCFIKYSNSENINKNNVEKVFDIKTLNSDKKVYKVVLKTEDPDIVTSKILKFKYKLKKRYNINGLEINIHKYCGLNYLEINEGFHAYTSLDVIKNFWKSNQLVKIVECTIPKGSKYCENDEYKECVSDSIIINKVCV